MVCIIDCEDSVAHAATLAGTLTRIVREGERVTVVDCRNSLHPYLFARRDLGRLRSQVFVTRVERLYDLLDLLERIAGDPYFWQSDVLVLTAYHHLIEDAPAHERRTILPRILRMIERLEGRHQIRAITLRLHTRWATRYRRNARSSTTSSAS